MTAPTPENSSVSAKSAAPAPTKYPEWHKIGLQLLLEGKKPTAQSLIDRRGGGSMTTATAALNEFHEQYLPSVLNAATLGAPAEVSELAADIWKRLAEYARAAAAREFEALRGELQETARRLQQELASAIDARQALAKELDAAREMATRQEARALGAEGQLAEQQRIVADLNRALSQLQRDHDRFAGELAQARAAAAERKTELAELREDHRNTLAGVRSQHQEEIKRLAAAHEAAVAALADRAAIAATEHERALQAQGTLHQAERDAWAVASADASAREQDLASQLAEARARQVVLQEQNDQATLLATERLAERDRLLAQVDTLQASVRSLSEAAARKKVGSKGGKRQTGE